MSTDAKQFLPEIAAKLDYVTADIYLLQQGILTVAEFESFQKALQNGSLSNGDVVRKLLPKILQKPREFYRALRKHIQDDYNVHTGNVELFNALPENFAKGILKKAFGKLKSSQKSKPPISTIAEDPVSSSDTDKILDQLPVGSPSPTEGHISSDEESDYETRSPGPYNRSQPEFASTRSLFVPRTKKKSYSRQLSEMSYRQRSTTSQQHHPTRQRSSSVNENHLACNMKAHSSSELNQPIIAEANSVTKSTTTEKHQNSQMDLPTDGYTPFEDSRKPDHATLQQQIDSVKSSTEESINQLQQQLNHTKSSLEKVIAKLQKDIIQLQNKQSGYNQNETDHETFKMQIEAEKQKAAEAQEALAQASAEVQEKDKALKESQYELRSMVQKLEEAKTEHIKEFEKYKRDHDSKITEYTNEIQKYKGHLQEKAGETLALRKSQHELQLMMQKLEEALKQSKIDYDSKITEFTKEIETYKNLYDAEKLKAQEALTKVFAEKQNIEKQLQDALEQCDAHIKKIEDSKQVENTNIRKIQDKVLQEKDITIKKLQDENKRLKMAKNKVDSEQEVATKEREAVLQDLAESKEQYNTLEERFHKVLTEKQNNEIAMQNLLKDLEQSNFEKENQKLLIKDLEKKLQQNEKSQLEEPTVQGQFTDTAEAAPLTEETPAGDEQTETPTKDQQAETPKEEQQTVTSRKDQQEVTENPSLQKDKDIPPKQPPSNDVPKSVTPDRSSKLSLPKSPSFGSGQISKPRNPTPRPQPPPKPQPPPRPKPPQRAQPPPRPQPPQPAELHKLDSSSKILKEKPSWWNVRLYVIPKIMDQWKDVALNSLNFDTSMIAEIEKKGKNDPKHCCTILFEDWLETENGVNPKTWETLLTQLRKIELSDKIEEIKKQLQLKK